MARNQYHVIMEVAPQYWQNPEALKQVYVSTSGGSVHGSQASNAVAGTFVAPGQPSSATAAATDAARNQATNSITSTGKTAASTGSAVSTSAETMVPLSAVASYRPRQHAACGQPPGPVRRHHDLVQPCARRCTQ